MHRSIVLLLSVLVGTAIAQPSPATATATSAPPPSLREVAPGVFEYNGVRLDKKNHRVSFPATVNQRQGLIEYLLVNDQGKIHESLLATKLLPRDIHVALLLIGLNGDAIANRSVPLPPQAIDTPYLQSAPKLKGTPVRLSIAWTDNGKRREVAAENWIFNLQSNRVMSPGPWTYNGSMMEGGVFLADQELSLVSVITDPTALVNNPREGYDNDEIWQVLDKVVPPLDTPVEVTITLAESTPPKP